MRLILRWRQYMWSMASEEPRAGRMRGLRQISARGLTYRAMCIPWMYRNMQKVMDSGWRRPPGYCAMKRLKRRQADILAKLPMQQTKSRVTAGRQSLRLRTIWRTTQRQFFFRCFAEAERRDSPACIRFL